VRERNGEDSRGGDPRVKNKEKGAGNRGREIRRKLSVDKKEAKKKATVPDSGF